MDKKRKYRLFSRGKDINIWAEQLPDGTIGGLKLVANKEARKNMRSRYDEYHNHHTHSIEGYLEGHLGNGWSYGDAEFYNIDLSSATDLIGLDILMDDEGDYIVEEDDNMWIYGSALTRDPLDDLMRGKAAYYERV